ncbi:MAG TPA: alcohol dehydrogenase catalytic domain-containing protein [Candidatus Limnocylindrales bacterium]|nr:alcohol dehydrogenase catalytic domain-containing protein [Candidatus Limnocylindrales bacterium]
MRAVRLHAVGEELRFEDVPMPEPAGSEVRIRIAGCGVCHTDLHVVDGTQTRVELPVTLGHEVAGWVDAVGPAAEGTFAIGDAVVVHGGWGCGECGDCRAGDEQRCERAVAPGFQANGGYAEAMLVPHPRHLVPLGSLDPVRAAPLADAGVTPYRAVRRAERWLVAGARVLQIGSGGLGQFALQYLRLVPQAGRGLIVGVSEVSPDPLARAADLGADYGLLGGEPETWIEALGGPASVVIDFVGTDATLALAASTVAPDGLVVLVGEAGGSMPFAFDRIPIESWLTTVAWGSHEDLRRVVALAQSGQLQWEVETVPLAEAAAAHARLRAGNAPGRLVLVP